MALYREVTLVVDGGNAGFTLRANLTEEELGPIIDLIESAQAFQGVGKEVTVAEKENF